MGQPHSRHMVQFSTGRNIPLRHRGSVLQLPAAGCCIAPQLARDGRRRASELSSNLRDTELLSM